MEPLGLLGSNASTDLPLRFEPMLATLAAEPPRSGGHAFEFKWDGIRAIVTIAPGVFRIQTRHGGDVTGAFPELAPLAHAVKDRRVVLDGEVVALDEKGRPSFSRLQHRLGRTDPPKGWLASHPVSLILFDLLHVDGLWLVDEPYLERRRRLEALHLEGPAWSTPAYHLGSAAAVIEASRDLGLEGIVAKDIKSVYRPGVRTRAWLKVKNRNRQEFVVGGWSAGEGRRMGAVGSLLVGYYSTHGGRRLTFAGRVGSGFTEQDAEEWLRRLQPFEEPTSSFEAGPAPPPDSRFVSPRYVVDVEYSEWTPDGILRHPVYLGMRGDKRPHDVVREDTER